MSELTNPHDRFFKESLSREEVALDFMKNYLPADVLALLNLDSLELAKDTFVDKYLMEYYSDLLYKLDLKDDTRAAYIYILFEHKSYRETYIAFDLLRYMVRIWENVLKTKSEKKLPFIIPIVLYHGSRTWEIGRHLRGLFDAHEVFSPFIPDFRYILWDSSSYTDEEIKGEVMLRVSLLIMKHIFSKDLIAQLPNILRLLRELVKGRSGLEYIETVLKYVINTTSKSNVTFEDLHDVIREALPQAGGEIMPTIAEALIEQGVQKGIQQGMEQGMLKKAREAVYEILEARFNVVTLSIIESINAIDNLLFLKVLHKKSATVDSIDQFKQVMKELMDE